MSFRSSQEIAAEKNAEKIERLKAERLRAFEEGLERLERLDVKKGPETTSREYTEECYSDLSTILARAEATRPRRAPRPIDED